MRFVVNPGSGTVPKSTLQLALSNVNRIAFLLKARGCEGVRVERDESGDGNDGRFGFTVVGGNSRPLSVLVPGVPWTELGARSAWAPRLYVDGNTWELDIAIDLLKEEFTT
jgi:hypothetical protein